MNTFVIETNNLLRQIERDAKTTACFLCGKKIDSPCNSHLVPRFILKEIAQQGMVEYGQSLSRLQGREMPRPFQLVCLHVLCRRPIQES